MEAPYRLTLTPAALTDCLDGAFPFAARPSFGVLTQVGPGHVRMRLEPTPDMLRPGEIVSGPALMGFADVAAYALVLAHVGPIAMAVTSTLNMSFLRACRSATVLADARLLKLGRRVATIEVRLSQHAEDRLVAQTVVAYALP